MKTGGVTLKKIIIVRASPDWGGLSAKLQQQGRLAPSDYLPTPLPAGFPPNVPDILDLWNSSLAMDFFSVRAAVGAIAQKTWQKTGADYIMSVPDFIQWAATHPDEAVCLFPTDDDDFFAPHLFEGLAVADRPYIRRFPSPIYVDMLFNRPLDSRFPRLMPRLRRLYGRYPRKLALFAPLVRPGPDIDGLQTLACDYFCQTNNYALMGRGSDWGSKMHEVADHIDVSRVLDRFKYRWDDGPAKQIALTNKHPCSISRLMIMLREGFKGATLRRGLEEYVRSFDHLTLPADMAWMQTPLFQLRDLFANLLDAKSAEVYAETRRYNAGL
ncbi:hypothetical protein SAMN04488071_1952 [Kordiimonas lacus]|uniref:Uncharacterized protein n=2 Tax=Kordiimonadaceae TaxID=1331809 RepID=A0A1G6ZTR3_9PROT|nr:hypothetical protein SAMN04488071_1952 [Kordiimonas lacus]